MTESKSILMFHKNYIVWNEIHLECLFLGAMAESAIQIEFAAVIHAHLEFNDFTGSGSM